MAAIIIAIIVAAIVLAASLLKPADRGGRRLEDYR